MPPPKLDRDSPKMDETPRAPPRQSGTELGQSVVELALVTPILLVLVFGIADFAWAFHAYIILLSATHEGARYGAVGNPAGTFPTDCGSEISTSVIARVCSTMGTIDLSDVEDVSVSYPDGQVPGGSIVVSTRYRHQLVTPLGSLLTAATQGSISGILDLSATADMRLE